MLTLQQRLAQAQMEKAGATPESVNKAVDLAEQHNAAVEELRGLGFGVVESEGRAVIVTGARVRFPQELMSDRFDRESVAVRFDTAERAVETLRKHGRALAEDTFARIEGSNAARDAFARKFGEA